MECFKTAAPSVIGSDPQPVIETAKPIVPLLAVVADVDVVIAGTGIDMVCTPCWLLFGMLAPFGGVGTVT
jgi:hypothetical protein